MADGNKGGGGAEDFVILRSDRRKHLRVALLVINVTVNTGNTFFGYAKDISRGGMFISSVNPKKTGDEFTVSFKLPETNEQVAVKVRVAWTRGFDPKSGAEPGMGLKFLDLDEAVAAKIASWAESKQKKKG